MRFDDRTLWGRDDEMDEYGDSGAYGESLEENFEEEEEEEEESGVVEDRPDSVQEEARQKESGTEAGQKDREEEAGPQEGTSLAANSSAWKPALAGFRLLIFLLAGSPRLRFLPASPGRPGR